MIRFRNIKKRFHSNVVLDGIDFDVKKGDVIAVIGPSGTGKSPLLRCIDLLEKPESGTVEFDDFRMDYAKYTAKELAELRKMTTMVFQSFNLFQKKTALKMSWRG